METDKNKMEYYPTYNALYCGDNLVVLPCFPPEYVDLIYIDPPFFSGKNYDITFKDPIAVKEYGVEKEARDGYASIAFNDMFDGKIKGYLQFMSKRLKELYRVLKPTGSFYLHCDYHASHYLKMLCDRVFGNGDIDKGRRCFVNEIIWHYSRLSNAKKFFPRMHDTILVYGKGGKRTFNIQYQPYKKHPNERNRFYNIAGHNQLIIYDKEKWEEVKYLPKYRKFVKKYKIIYIDPSKGVVMHDVWHDINILNQNDKERLGYQTQKPEELLERIIKTNSNEGDIVLDAFCGGGTTCAVAKGLNRKFIGIDWTPTALLLTADRIEYPKNEIYGLSNVINKMKEDIHWRTCQIWTINEVGGKPHTTKQEKAEGTFTFGIDGTLMPYKTKFNKKLPIEVKKHKTAISIDDIRKFSDKIREKKVTHGLFISMTKLSGPAMRRIESLKDEGIYILLLMFDDIISYDFKSKLREFGIFPRKTNGTCDLLELI